MRFFFTTIAALTVPVMGQAIAVPPELVENSLSVTGWTLWLLLLLTFVIGVLLGVWLGRYRS